MNKRIKIKAHPSKWKICTEGVTEANYLKMYIKALGIDKYIIVNCKDTAESGCGKQHEALLDKMQSCGRSWNVEQVFLVHDYDKAEEQKEAKASFNITFKRAKKESDFIVIYSNPCFEYWLLLHNDFIDSNLQRNIFQEKVKDICNKKRADKKMEPLHDDKYKSDPMLYEYFGGYNNSRQARKYAIKRFAENGKQSKPIKSIKSFSSEYYANKTPCTNMFELLDALDKYARQIKYE